MTKFFYSNLFLYFNIGIWNLYLELYTEIPEYLLNIWLVYKTSRYTIIY